MSIELEIYEDNDLHRVTLWSEANGDHLTLNEIEDLELELTKIISQLYAYRREHKK